MGRSAPRREEIIDDLLTDCAVEEAAVQAGFAAGEDEVAALVDSQRQTYTDFPEARAVVDSYCEDTGITLEDYWAMQRSRPGIPLSRPNIRSGSMGRSCRSWRSAPRIKRARPKPMRSTARSC